jgi:hypothetical protein
MQRRSVGFASDTHGTTGSLTDRIEGWKVRVRSVWSKPLDLCINDAWIYPAYILVAKPETFYHSWCEIFDEDVSFLQKLPHKLFPFRMFEFNRHGLFV